VRRALIARRRPVAATGATAGYSGTPLPRKLGLKDVQRVLFVGLPGTLEALTGAADFAGVTELADWRQIATAGAGYDFVHAFTRSRKELAAGLPRLQSAIAANGMMWISWPKRAARVETDVTEDVVRAEALALDLVDVKVAAVDDHWSGLKLVIRKDRRHRHGA